MSVLGICAFFILLYVKLIHGVVEFHRSMVHWRGGGYSLSWSICAFFYM